MKKGRAQLEIVQYQRHCADDCRQAQGAISSCRKYDNRKGHRSDISAIKLGKLAKSSQTVRKETNLNRADTTHPSKPEGKLGRT
jgi:hypothetical protein